MIHALWRGLALCGAGSPSTWPPGTRWVAKDDAELLREVNCPACRADLDKDGDGPADCDDDLVVRLRHAPGGSVVASVPPDDKDCDGAKEEAPADEFHRCPACGMPCACDYEEGIGECEHAGGDCEPDHPNDCDCEDCDDDRTAAIYMAQDSGPDDDCDEDGDGDEVHDDCDDRPAELAASGRKSLAQLAIESRAAGVPTTAELDHKLRWWREGADGKLELTTEPPAPMPPPPLAVRNFRCVVIPLLDETAAFIPASQAQRQIHRDTCHPAGHCFCDLVDTIESLRPPTATALPPLGNAPTPEARRLVERIVEHVRLVPRGDAREPGVIDRLAIAVDRFVADQRGSTS